jgi:hypothetical protein
MLILEVKQQTLFVKLKDVYPECEFLISDQEQLHPFICFTSHCHRNANCMEKLAGRVKYIFDGFPHAQLLLLYFSYRDKPASQRAGVFWRDLREPKYIVFNRTAWEKMKQIGTVYEWNLPDSFFLTGHMKQQFHP